MKGKFLAVIGILVLVAALLPGAVGAAPKPIDYGPMDFGPISVTGMQLQNGSRILLLRLLRKLPCINTLILTASWILRLDASKWQHR